MTEGRDLARLFRTVKQLHPLQVLTRVPHLAVAKAMAGMPSVFAPRVRSIIASSAPPAMVKLAEAERDRSRKRITHLPAGSRLRAYEAAYGLELGADGEPHSGTWKGRVALEPYPASVRARRLAVRMRCGSGRGRLGGELARACRAVLVQPEVHLMANHLLENGFALVSGGAIGEGREADVWFEVGRAILDWQLPEQFLADGGHFERSASYHVGLTHALLETIELSRAGGRVVPAAWEQIAKRALGWMVAVRAPDGTYPLFNDAALDAAPALDAVLELGSALGLIDAAAGAAASSDRGEARAVHLADTGWVLLHHEGVMVAFDAGKDGASYQPGHVHADALTLELWVGGQRVVVDYGVASYARDGARETSRATRAHNTIEVEGQDSSEVWAAFRVGRRARGTLHELYEGSEPGGAWLAAEASHDGYAYLPGAPVHTRRLELRANALTVSDRIERSVTEGPALALVGRMRADRRAREASGLRVESGEDGAAVRTRADVWFADHGVAREAEVFEQRGLVHDHARQSWRIGW